MKKSRGETWLAICLLITSFVTSVHSNAVSAATGNPNEPLADTRRPRGVPDGYVITPFGYFHPSCVQSLAKGERLLDDGRVQHSDGSLERSFATCKYPRYSRTGFAPRKGLTTISPLEISGWLENANITTGSNAKSYAALVARWTVPSQPASNDGQLLYFFPGFEDIGKAQSILQPVMAWYQGQWTIASWNCCLNGVIEHSPPVNVAPGDKLYGSITSTCAAGSLSCSTWNVLSIDLTTGDSTLLADAPSEGQLFNWAFGGVLEPYYVVSCNDYPPEKQLMFSEITVFDENRQAIAKPKWLMSVDTVSTPKCNYGINGNPQRVTLRF
jgi:hypothetical protein